MWRFVGDFWRLKPSKTVSFSIFLFLFMAKFRQFGKKTKKMLISRVSDRRCSQPVPYSISQHIPFKDVGKLSPVSNFLETPLRTYLLVGTRDLRVYFSTQKKKISMLFIFSNSQISNNSRYEPSDVIGFPFSRRLIWRSKLTCLQRWARGNTKPPSQACVCLSTTTTRTWCWNISDQVRLISKPRFDHRQTVCAGRRRIQRACVSPPSRPAPGAGTFLTRCGSFQDLNRQTHRQTKWINI
jgi:hypothetical protein